MQDDALLKDKSGGRLDWTLAGALGLVGLGGMLALTWYVWPAYLVYADCAPYILQAHTFSQGQLTRSAPPETLAPFFRTNSMIQLDGREFSKQPPGASALFALIMLATKDVRWAPPVVSALALTFSFLWIRRAYDRLTAFLAVGLCACTFMHLMLAASVLSYSPSSLFLAVAMLLFAMYLKRPSRQLALFCGLFVGLQFTARPFTAVLAAVAMASVRLLLFRRHRGLVLQALAFATGVIPGVLIFLIHNRLVTGDWWPLAFSLYDPSDRVGFGPRGVGDFVAMHTPRAALGRLAFNLHTVARLFFVPWVWLVPILAWWFDRILSRSRSEAPRMTRWDFSLILTVLVLVVGHTAYWAARPINYFETYPFLAALIARGTLYLATRSPFFRVFAWVTFGSTALLGAAASWPILAEPVPRVHRIHAVIEQTRERAGPLLVFTSPDHGVQGESIPVLRDYSEFSAGLFNVSPPCDQPVIYAVNRGPSNVLLARQYPNHRPFVLLDVITDPNDEASPFELHMIPLSRYLQRPATTAATETKP